MPPGAALLIRPVPAPQRYPAPHQQLLTLAREAKAEELTFDEFWERAVRPGLTPVRMNHPDPPTGAILWPRDTTDRRITMEAIQATREAWRCSYEDRRQTRSERAFASLASV